MESDSICALRVVYSPIDTAGPSPRRLREVEMAMRRQATQGRTCGRLISSSSLSAERSRTSSSQSTLVKFFGNGRNVTTHACQLEDACIPVSLHDHYSVVHSASQIRFHSKVHVEKRRAAVPQMYSSTDTRSLSTSTGKPPSFVAFFITLSLR